MSMAIAHFALGAGMTTVLVVVFLPAVRYPRTVSLLGGGWAMVPDFHWVSPIARQQLRQLHQTSPWTDLFWFHRTLDRVDPGDSPVIAAALLAGFFLATVVAERRDYRAPELIASSEEGYR